MDTLLCGYDFCLRWAKMTNVIEMRLTSAILTLLTYVFVGTWMAAAKHHRRVCCCRRSQFENTLLVQSWRIYFEDIEMVNAKGKHKDASVSRQKSILLSYLFFC